MLAFVLPHPVASIRSSSTLVPPPDGISLWFPKDPSWGWKYDDELSCNYLDSPGIHTSDEICQAIGPDYHVLTLSAPENTTSVRYQAKQKVSLWKKGSHYAASFSTRFTFARLRGSKAKGGGIAFAITPTFDVPNDISGFDTLGLFAINTSTNSTSVHTLAIEIDLSSSSNDWDFLAPHIGLDLNSLRSSVVKPLPSSLLDGRKIGIFIDYNAATQHLSVLVQDLKVSRGVLDRSKAIPYLNYYNLNLSNYVLEESFIGFSADVPVASDGAYAIYHWKFDTKWVNLA